MLLRVFAMLHAVLMLMQNVEPKLSELKLLNWCRLPDVDSESDVVAQWLLSIALLPCWMQMPLMTSDEPCCTLSLHCVDVVPTPPPWWRLARWQCRHHGGAGGGLRALLLSLAANSRCCGGSSLTKSTQKTLFGALRAGCPLSVIPALGFLKRQAKGRI